MAACALVGAVACGPHKMGGDDTGSGSDGDTITVSPATSDLQIVNGIPGTEPFSATLVHPDGSKEDITAGTTFGIDNFGSFTGNTLSMTGGGKATVYAAYGEATGTAEVIGHLQITRVDGSLGSDVPSMFGAGSDDPSRVPAIVYPPVNTIMPRNIGDFEVHWTDASNNDVWEVSLHTAYSDVYVYVPASAPANFTAFQPAEWAQAVGAEDSVDFQVRGMSSAAPGLIGSAPLQTVQLSNEDMNGGLYYWSSHATDMSAYGIFRHDMSKPGQPAEEFMTTDQTSGRCVACHVLSKDGTKMAITYDGGGGAATFIDVASATPQASTGAWNFGAFVPDGTEFFSVENGAMVLRNYTDQSVIATVPTLAGATASQPDVASNGSLLYVVTNDGGAWPNGQADWSLLGGQIVVQSFDQTSNTFGTPTVLVADGNNNYYPSWSPDGQWVLFNKATDGGTSYNDASTELWVVKADGSQPPVRLANADAAANATNSWGRWAPFAQTFGANDEPMFWVTVSSKRDFGVRLVGLGQPQIWMSPFFPDRAAAGMDPTVPMFRLPFQDINHNNHIAQWTQQIVSINAKGK